VSLTSATSAFISLSLVRLLLTFSFEPQDRPQQSWVLPGHVQDRGKSSALKSLHVSNRA